MALNVLLVDDEYLVLKGLEIILSEQSEVDLKLVSAMDAADALGKLSSFRPDVVVADINMPEVDGFSMIEEIRGRFPRCRFIICSGYDEQNYLKQALRLHVADYFLKPVDKASLIRRLREIADEKETLVSHTLLRIQLLLLKGQTGNEADFPENELGAIFPEDAFCLCAVNLPGPDPESAQKYLARYFDTVYTLTLNARAIYLLNCPGRVQQGEIRSVLGSAFDGALMGCSFFSSGESKAAAVSRIVLAYQEALGEMVLSLLPEASDVKRTALSSLTSRTLFPAVRVITFEGGIEDYIRELYDATPKESCLALAFTEIISAYFMVSDISLSADLIRQLYPTGSGAPCTKKALVHFIKKILNFWYDSFSQGEHANCSSKVASACRYMDVHYQEDLSLDQIAELLAMNPSYLSYIFKKETGLTLVQYLTNVRLGHACRLLQAHPELSLDEIAAQSGYHSTTYFHKSFRSRFGVSPRQWQG